LAVGRTRFRQAQPASGWLCLLAHLYPAYQVSTSSTGVGSALSVGSPLSGVPRFRQAQPAYIASLPTRLSRRTSCGPTTLRREGFRQAQPTSGWLCLLAHLYPKYEGFDKLNRRWVGSLRWVASPRRTACVRPTPRRTGFRQAQPTSAWLCLLAHLDPEYQGFDKLNRRWVGSARWPAFPVVRPASSSASRLPASTTSTTYARRTFSRALPIASSSTSLSR
jgi:hypothetical protein